MNVLLLNLTRFGDLLQSQPAIADLAGQGHKVAVLCLRNFAEGAGLLSGVTRVFSLRGAAMLAQLADDGGPAQEARSTPERRAWHTALAELAALRDTVYADFAPDALCNLTPSLSARMLSLFLAKGNPCMGFSMDERGFGVNGNAWAAFMQGAAVSRKASPFNVADMFRMIARPPGFPALPRGRAAGDASLVSPGPEKLLAANEYLKKQAPGGSRGFAALQLGASENKRRWPVSSFAVLGGILWREEALCPVLLGSKAETPLAERYAGAADHPFIDMCGQTGIEDLACVLRASRILISNDTGTMHLAAGLGLPVLAIFLATAQPFDTGPYQAGSCCVEPDMHCHPCAFDVHCLYDEACRHAVRPEFMAMLALSRLRLGEWRAPPDPGPEAGKNSARVWLSEFDEEGYIALRSLPERDDDDRVAWIRMQRHYLRCFLDRDRSRDFLPDPMPGRLSLSSAARGEILASVGRAQKLVELLQQQGKVLLDRPVPMMRDRFLSTWQKTHDVLRENAWCGSLSLLWAQETQAGEQELPAALSMARQFGQLLNALAGKLAE